jgi:hypothetical protein
MMFGYTHLKSLATVLNFMSIIKSRLAPDTALPFPYIIGIISLGIYAGMAQYAIASLRFR